MNTKEANDLLPQKPTKVQKNPLRLNYLVIGLPKVGKTTLACSAPESLLLAFERGHAFQETHKISVDWWDRGLQAKKDGPGEDEDGVLHMSLAEARDAIVASDRFQMVIVDTADMAAKMCLDHHYQKMGVQHATDAGDWGRGWDVTLVQPFRQMFGPIMKSGRGIIFITHSKIVQQKLGNTVVSRAETTLPSQIQQFLHSQADVILHYSFGRKLPNRQERDRIITLDGSNEILAGSRVREVNLPKKFIVSPENPFKQWTSFFTDPKAVAAAEAEYEKVYGTAHRTLDADPAIAAETLSSPAEPEAPAKGGKVEKTNK